jgi:hypothetical protein
MTGGYGFALINLDLGTVISGTYEDISVEPMGTDPDDGYFVTIDNLTHQDGGEMQMCLLVGSSYNYRDQTGVGYFYAQDATIDQRRVSQWDDVRGATGYVWTQSTDTHRPVIWSDSRGACLSFKGGNPAVVLGCTAAAALCSGTSKPVSIAVAMDSGSNNGTLFMFRNSSTGYGLWLLNNYAGGKQSIHRTREDSDGKVAEVSKTAPYSGTVIGRYNGSSLDIRADGVDGTPGTQTGALTVDTAFIGGNYDNPAGNPFRGKIREIIVWGRGISGEEAIAVDNYLTAKWGY